MRGASIRRRRCRSTLRIARLPPATSADSFRRLIVIFSRFERVRALAKLAQFLKNLVRARMIAVNALQVFFHLRTLLLEYAEDPIQVAHRSSLDENPSNRRAEILTRSPATIR